MASDDRNRGEIVINYIMRCGLELKRQTEEADGRPEVILLSVSTCPVEEGALSCYVEASRKDCCTAFFRTTLH